MTSDIPARCRKRMDREYQKMQADPHDYVDAFPDESNKLIWYFCMRGPPDSDFQGGYYLGKLKFPKEYPMKPPQFFVLTPNGRFAIEKKICLSNSSYHSETWSPMWNIQRMIIGMQSMMTESPSGVAHIADTSKNRRKLARNSVEYNKKYYSHIISNFTRFFDEDGNPKMTIDEAVVDDAAVELQKCPQCEMECPNLEQHLAEICSERPAECRYCHEKFALSILESHSNRCPIRSSLCECPFCEYLTADANLLAGHMAQSHPEFAMLVFAKF